ncbi:MAG: hypothetical protein HY651_04135 [Acidobacteria bacterium]|nr:hypothetical protein [Acidobacteriota bacterium]
MIKDVEFWEAWQRDQERSEPPDYKRNCAIFEAMYDHARSFDTFQCSDSLEGIDVKIRIAQALNVRPSARTDRQ